MSRAILLRWLWWRHVRRHRLRTLLALCSIALGVATFVGMSALNRSTVRSFERTARLRAGDADLVVSGGSGPLEQELALELARVDGVASAAPVILRLLTVSGPWGGPSEVLLVVGADPTTLGPDGGGLLPDDLMEELASPLELLRFRNPMFFAADWARARGLAVGATVDVEFPGGRQPVEVAGLLRGEALLGGYGGAVGVSLLARLQELLGVVGRVDRVHVRLRPDADPAATETRIRAVVGERAMVQDPLQEARDFDAVHGSLRLALRLISLCSLLIAAFLVYTTVSMTLTERRLELAILRCLGMGARAQGRLLMAEAAVLGGLGSLLGVGLGALLARALAQMFWTTIGGTFDRIDPAPATLSAGDVLLGLLAGPAAALLAAAWPALRAARRAPLQGLRHERAHALSARARIVMLVAGGGLALLCAGWIVAPPVHVRRGGYFVFLLLVAAVALGAYPLMSFATRPFGRWFLRVLGPAGRLARDHFERASGSTSLTLVAMTLGFGLVFSTDVLVKSFEFMLRDWFRVSIREDLFVVGERFLTSGLQGQSFDRELGDRIEALDGVQHVHRLHFSRVEIGGDRVMLMTFGGAAPAASGTLVYREGSAADLAPFARGEGVFVSEGFAYRQGLARGDPVSLPTPRGRHELPVLAVITDYTWPLGTLYLEDDAYRALYDVPDVHEFAVTLEEGADLEVVRTQIRGLLDGRYTALVMTNQEVQDTVFGVFREYWSLLLAQEGLAVLVAFLGAFHTLLISVLLRRREIGLLRAMGAPVRVVRRMIRIEGVLLGLGGGILGVAFGSGVAAVVLVLLCLEESGFRAPVVVSASTALLVIGGAGITGWLAGLVPSRQAARTDALQVLCEE